MMICSRCGAVDTEHYTYKTKTGDKPLQYCKPCHNAGKYQKKATGWAKVSEEIKTIVRTMLADRRNKIVDIAAATGISAVNLGRWINAGKITN